MSIDIFISEMKTELEKLGILAKVIDRIKIWSTSVLSYAQCFPHYILLYFSKYHAFYLSYIFFALSNSKILL